MTKAMFKVTARRKHQGVFKFRVFPCTYEGVPRSARNDGWEFVSAERVS